MPRRSLYVVFRDVYSSSSSYKHICTFVCLLEIYIETSRILGSPAHVVSCATNKWRLSSNTVDDGIFSSLPQNLLGLGSLYQENGSPVLEPDTGNPYRVRVLGCPIRGMHPVPMLLEDIDRSFDGDLVTLSSCILKMCLRYVFT